MTILLLSSSTVYSQQNIPEPEIKLKRHQAIAVVKDLTRYDSLKVSYRLLEENISNLKMISEQKDAKILEYKDSENRLHLIISNYSALQLADKTKYRELERNYKKEVRAGRFKLVLMGGLAAFAIYKSIK